ncbi:MAG: choice-of-anchor tandem repeat NxxGxxAF-containing protein [Planctomycetota bacterium]
MLLSQGDAITGTSKTFNFDSGIALAPINDSGTLALAPQLIPARGGGDNSLLTIAPDGTVTVLAIEDDPAPGTNNEIFRLIDTPSLNNANQIAFVAGTEDASGDFFFDDTLYRYDPNTGFELLAEAGDPAPLPGNATFANDFRDPIIGADGTVVFDAGVSGGDDGLFKADPFGTITAIALENSTVATPEFGGNVFSRFSSPVVNASGQVLFDGSVEQTGAVTEANNEGLFLLDTSGSLSLVMREGDTVPGDPNKTFQDPAGSELIFNDDGTFAFAAEFDEAGFAEREGLFFGDTATGAIDLILAEGELFEVLPGDFRTIDGFDLRPSGGAGRFIALDVDFTDDSDAIILVTIPEPSSLTLLGLGGLTLLRRRR